MTDSYINLKDLWSDFQTAYDAVMYGSGLSSNGSAQNSAVVYAKQVKKTLPNNYLITLMPDEDGYHNRFSSSRFRVEASGNLPSALESSDGAASSDAAGKFFTASSLKQMQTTTLDSEEPCLDEPLEVSVQPKMVQKADSGRESETKIVQAWSMAVEEGSHSVNNSDQYSNVQIFPIIQAVNLGNEHVLTPREQVAGNKASRLERQRWRGKDPTYSASKKELLRERMRERRKVPTLKARENERQRERMRERRKVPTFKARENERQRDRMRERRKDPAFVARERELQRERRKDPSFIARNRASQKSRPVRIPKGVSQKSYLSAGPEYLCQHVQKD